MSGLQVGQWRAFKSAVARPHLVTEIDTENGLVWFCYDGTVKRPKARRMAMLLEATSDHPGYEALTRQVPKPRRR